MLPLLFKHYFTPIQLHDIPAIREDDGSAASLGAFRAYQAKKDKVYAEKHNGEKRKRDLGLDLLRLFSPEIVVQAVSPLMSRTNPFLKIRLGPPSSSACSIFPLSVFAFYFSTSATEARPTNNPSMSHGSTSR